MHLHHREESSAETTEGRVAQLMMRPRIFSGGGSRGVPAPAPSCHPKPPIDFDPTPMPVPLPMPIPMPRIPKPTPMPMPIPGFPERPDGQRQFENTPLGRYTGVLYTALPEPAASGAAKDAVLAGRLTP